MRNWNVQVYRPDYSMTSRGTKLCQDMVLMAELLCSLSCWWSQHISGIHNKAHVLMWQKVIHNFFRKEVCKKPLQKKKTVRESLSNPFMMWPLATLVGILSCWRKKGSTSNGRCTYTNDLDIRNQNVVWFTALLPGLKRHIFAPLKLKTSYRIILGRISRLWQ